MKHRSDHRGVVDRDRRAQLGTGLAATAVTVATLGFGFPVGLVLLKRRQALRTTVDGRRVEFTGSARELFRDWLPWWLLTLVTLGVYGVWVFPRVAAWTREHTRVGLRPVWAYDASPAEPVRPLAAPSRLSLPFFTEAGPRPLVG